MSDMQHTCITDDGGTPNRRCYACEAERQAHDDYYHVATVEAVTAVVREADAVFMKVGGSSRHWVRDCFLPLLDKAGLRVVAKE